MDSDTVNLISQLAYSVGSRLESLSLHREVEDNGRIHLTIEIILAAPTASLSHSSGTATAFTPGLGGV